MNSALPFKEGNGRKEGKFGRNLARSISDFFRGVKGRGIIGIVFYFNQVSISSGVNGHITTIWMISNNTVALINTLRAAFAKEHARFLDCRMNGRRSLHFRGQQNDV